jgi:hypothetical protein
VGHPRSEWQSVRPGIRFVVVGNGVRVVVVGGGATDADTLLNRYHELDTSEPGLAAFHTRLALSFIDTLGHGTG